MSPHSRRRAPSWVWDASLSWREQVASARALLPCDWKSRRHGIATYWIDGAHLDQQLAMLAFTLGVPWAATNVQPLNDKLESQRACIVLDGLTFTPEVCGIPRPSTRVAIIATTRERGIIPLLPHDATLVDVSVLAPPEARQLLRRLVGLPFLWTDNEIDETTSICGYLPLALVLDLDALHRKMVSSAFLDGFGVLR